MNIDLSKYVLTPGQGEVITLGLPNSGKIIILVDPKNTGETRFCMLIQELDPGAVVPVHLHEREEQILFFYSGHGKAILGETEMEVHPGTTVYSPRQVWHGFSNTGTSPCVSWRRLVHRDRRMSFARSANSPLQQIRQQLGKYWPNMGRELSLIGEKTERTRAAGSRQKDSVVPEPEVLPLYDWSKGLWVTQVAGLHAAHSIARPFPSLPHAFATRGRYRGCRLWQVQTGAMLHTLRATTIWYRRWPFRRMAHWWPAAAAIIRYACGKSRPARLCGRSLSTTAASMPLPSHQTGR